MDNTTDNASQENVDPSLAHANAVFQEMAKYREGAFEPFQDGASFGNELIEDTTDVQESTESVSEDTNEFNQPLEESTEEQDDVQNLQTEEEENGESPQEEKEIVSQNLDANSLIGKEFSVDGQSFVIESPEDVDTLIHNGLKFSKLHSTLVPYEGHIKALVSNGITEPDALNTLIDAHKGDKGALAKLIQANGIDVQDLYDTEYKSNEYVESPEINAFNQRMDSIINSVPSMEPVIHNLITNDPISFQHLAGLPKGLEVLANHVEDGTYDRVVNQIKREDALRPSTFKEPMFNRDGTGRYISTFNMLKTAQNTVEKRSNPPKSKSQNRRNPNKASTHHQHQSKPRTAKSFTTSDEHAELVKEWYKRKFGAK